MSTIQDITLVIKTFERERMVKRLLKSISNSDLKVCPIVIADDSKEEVSYSGFDELDIKVVRLPFDSGASKGRNAAVNEVKTKYFLLLDDDYVIDNSVDYLKVLTEMEDNNYDIISGHWKNYRHVRIFSSTDFIIPALQRLLRLRGPKLQNYVGDIKFKEKEWEVTYLRKEFIARKTDICHHFFIADTNKVKVMGGWNELLKIGDEHLEFFVKAKKAGLVCGYTPSMYVKHFPEYNPIYKKYRQRSHKYFKIVLDQYNIEKIISIYPEEKIKKLEYLEKGKHKHEFVSM